MTEPRTGGNDLILITGASGFLGSAIAHAARGAGYRVRVLARASSPRQNLDQRDEQALGDIRDPQAVGPAMRGVRFLVHAAADYRLWVRDPEQMYRANVQASSSPANAGDAHSPHLLQRRRFGLR